MDQEIVLFIQDLNYKIFIKFLIFMNVKIIVIIEEKAFKSNNQSCNNQKFIF